MSIALFLWRTYLYEKSRAADIGREGQSAALHPHMNPGSMLRISQCEVEMGTDQTGRYPILISRAFPDGVIRITGTPKNPRNLHCRCQSHRWAICHIVVRAGSLEEALIINKFRGNDPLGGGMKPFRIFESQWDLNKIVFIETDAFGGRKVWAEMHLIHTDACLPSRMCTSPLMDSGTPVCPVLYQPFTNGESIFVPNANKDSVMKGRRSRCVSAMGLRQLNAEAISMGNLDGFIDPLDVVPSPNRVTIDDFFGIFLVISNEDYDNGFCDVTAMKIPDTMEGLTLIASGVRLSGGSWLDASDAMRDALQKNLKTEAGTSEQHASSELESSGLEPDSKELGVQATLVLSHFQRHSIIFTSILFVMIFITLFLTYRRNSSPDHLNIYFLYEYT